MLVTGPEQPMSREFVGVDKLCSLSGRGQADTVSESLQQSRLRKALPLMAAPPPDCLRARGMAFGKDTSRTGDPATGTEDTSLAG